jgi:hypothetical protein
MVLMMGMLKRYELQSKPSTNIVKQHDRGLENHNDMKQIYKIDAKHQFRSARKSMFYVYVALFVTAGFFFILPEMFSWWATILVGSFSIWLAIVMLAPFHIQYLAENWNTTLCVDTEKQTVTIEDKTGSYIYSFHDIKIVRYLIRHHKPGMIKSYDPVPFDYYGYLKINAPDKKIFYITSLMIDPFDFQLPITETKYGVPFINKTEPTVADKRRQIEFTKKHKVEEYVERFSKLSDDTLREKINNPKRYEVEAVEAANNVLNRRRKVTDGFERPTTL